METIRRDYEPKVGDSVAVEVVVLDRINPYAVPVSDDSQRPDVYSETVQTRRELMWGEVIQATDDALLTRFTDGDERWLSRRELAGKRPKI